MMFLCFFPPPILFQIQDGSWHQSRFFFHTQDSRQLPIVDIQEFPTSQPDSQRHIEIDPVCFLWHQHHRSCSLFTWATKIQGCLPKSECPLDFATETVNGTCWTAYFPSKAGLHGRTQSLRNIQAKKAKGEQCIPVFIDNCVKFVLLIIISRMVLRLLYMDRYYSLITG